MTRDNRSDNEISVVTSKEAEPVPAGEKPSEPMPGAPDKPAHQHAEELLDESLDETFPASDPITSSLFD